MEVLSEKIKVKVVFCVTVVSIAGNNLVNWRGELSGIVILNYNFHCKLWLRMNLVLQMPSFCQTSWRPEIIFFETEVSIYSKKHQADAILPPGS